jgi:hypothetical protein
MFRRFALVGFLTILVSSSTAALITESPTATGWANWVYNSGLIHDVGTLRLGSNGNHLTNGPMAPVIGFKFDSPTNLASVTSIKLTVTVTEHYSGGYSWAGSDVLADVYLNQNTNSNLSEVLEPNGMFVLDSEWVDTEVDLTFPAGTPASPYVLPYGTQVEIDLTDDLTASVAGSGQVEFVTMLYPSAFNGGWVELGEMGSAREPFLEIEYQASVPDTGSTAALLGVGVVALAFARRRLG